MKIYQDNGYLDVDSIMSTNDWCVCVYGGRGSGKTYGFLEWLTKNNICLLDFPLFPLIGKDFCG